MSIKPILFNTEMVRANLDGRKNNTRRIMKPQPVDTKYCNHEIDTFNDMLPAYYDGNYTCACRKCGYGIGPSGESMFKPPYIPGDILYVRETWGNYSYDCPESNATYFMYRADFPDSATGYWYEPEHIHFCDFPRWRPSIHMPKEAARLFLRVKNVRVERLRDIDSEGIRAEGLNTLAVHAGDMEISQQEFARLWDSTIKPSDMTNYGWDANPWVWVIEYERCDKPVEVN